MKNDILKITPTETQEIDPKLEHVRQGSFWHPLNIARFPVRLPITNFMVVLILSFF